MSFAIQVAIGEGWRHNKGRLNKPNTYLKLQIENVRSSDEDLLSYLCFEFGAGGVSENLKFRQNLEDYSIQTEETDLKTLDVFFENMPAAEFFEQLKAQFPDAKTKIETELNKDWLAEWKKGFVPFELVAGIWIVPHWCQAPTEAKGIIWMEPGMAFGTGTHETTQVAAELLAAALQTQKSPRVLDVGTGTGVLAILAQHLGASEVTGTDVDPEAVRVAKENLELNKISNIEVSDNELSAFSEGFDIVVANIIDGVLTTLQASLKRLVKPGGSLILSGIIDERRDNFESKFRREPLVLKKQISKNEWHGYLLERPR